MVASNQSAMTANMNTILRECIFIANVTNDADWILISRFIFSRMPMNLRQEAEFTLHMVWNWSQLPSHHLIFYNSLLRDVSASINRNAS